MLVYYQEKHLYFGNSFSQCCTKVIANSSQKETKHGNPHQSIENAEKFASICFWGNVPIP